MHKKIVLMGYMGSGKSILGYKIANKLNYKAIDLDAYIENGEKTSIRNLFLLKGEISFRKLEAMYLKEILEKDEDHIVSLGGGTPCYGDNLKFILENPYTISIFLQTGIEELSKRLFKEKEKRLLITHLKTMEELQEFIGKHLFERNFFYNQAQLIVKTDTKTPDVITEEIITKLL
jgi:shikimate kinase